MPVMFEETIYAGESRPIAVSYPCVSPLTGSFSGTCTFTLKNSAGTPVAGYNAVPVEAQDIGTAAVLSCRKQIDNSAGQIPSGKYEGEFHVSVSLSDGSVDEVDMIGEIDILPDTLTS